MATDIRRMSRDELDELNRLSKAWRERNKPAQDEPKPVADVTPIGNIPPIQMDLWDKEK